MAVHEVAAGATTTASRPVIAARPWHITIPPALEPVIAAQFGHLPTWEVARDPATLVIRTNSAPQRGLTSSGTVQWRVGETLRQVFPGSAVTIDDQWHVTVTLFGPDPLAAAIRTEVLTRLVMQRAAVQGLIPIHGAAIGAGGRFWVIPAIGGTGKSTATAVAATAGLQILGDDLVLWDPDTDMVFSVSGTLRLLPDSVTRFPPGMLAASGLHARWDRHDGKLVFQFPANRLAASGRLAGLLLIGAELPPATGSEALRALSSSIFQLTRVGVPAARAARSLAALSTRIPIQSLRRDPDLARWGATLAQACGDAGTRFAGTHEAGVRP